MKTFSKNNIPVADGKYDGVATADVVDMTVYEQEIPFKLSFIVNDEISGYETRVKILIKDGRAFVESEE